MCNPGGYQTSLSISSTKLKRNCDAGMRYGDDRYLPDSFPGAIGMVRASFGAMSSVRDVANFLTFVKRNLVDKLAVYESLIIIIRIWRKEFSLVMIRARPMFFLCPTPQATHQGNCRKSRPGLLNGDS